MRRGTGDPYTRPACSAMALVTIDMQHDFLRGPFAIPGTAALLPTVRRVVRAFRRANMPVIHLMRLYNADGTNVDLCRRRVVEQGARLVRPRSRGCRLAPGLLPTSSVRLDDDRLLAEGIQRISQEEVVIYKPRWGAFFNTPLERYLRARAVSSLAFAGCNFPNCPRASIYEASERDFRIVLIEDAVSGLYARARAELRRIGVWLMSAQELEQAIVASTQARRFKIEQPQASVSS